MQFIDANILVKAYTENPDKEDCRFILQTDFVTNTLCFLEAYHSISIIKQDKEYAWQCIKAIFKGKGIIYELDQFLLFEGLKRGQECSLGVFDLIHYTTALQANCEQIVSYDKDFDNLEIKRVEP
ncbi:MAG: type II toxin-antitoxin system VapC family toxin [Candidatus Woesearchaeota archaeon]|jgi:predicted nucleic acid-binding protein|nr:type II toxin-antitoxin system VapC family toxin [Candidatus Woesearchaeota archaeon]MDP7323725.1 type II toxin-antitoxin system VapC family toxin [Candidatus Woesearchaeota archaeon]MDP7457845.1 type II toxin-antitoxin system VapC family toxin [Candidatus Woesearchaeota archaeon]